MKLYSDQQLAEILDQDIFHLIGDCADELGVECYVVGGFVRDIFLERPSKDIDVVVVGSGIEVAKLLKKKIGRKARLSVFKNFGTAQVKSGTMEVEFVGARRESYSHDSRKPIVEDGTLEDDQNRRDFTINALAICLNKQRFGELVDPFDGLYDMEDGIIRTPLDPDITFSDDPLRMLRCVRFAAQLNFTIEEKTREALGRNAQRLEIISGERIQDELNKIMMTPTPSRGLYELYDTGLMQQILPELCALDIVETRNGRAHKNNFYHTLEVVDNVSKRPTPSPLKPTPSPSRGEGSLNSFPSCFSNISKKQNNITPNNSNQAPLPSGGAGGGLFPSGGVGGGSLWLRWAALLHDIGKPRCKRWEPGTGWTFHNHNYVGAKMVPQIFRRLKLPMDAKMKYVEKLVDLHMRPIAIADEEVTDSAVRRLLNDAGDDINDLMTLCEADITSKNSQRKQQFLHNFQTVREKLADLQERDYKRLLQPVVDGNEIMEMFHLKPSREVGTLKQTLKDAVLDNRVPNEREPLLQLLHQKAKEMGLEQGDKVTR